VFAGTWFGMFFTGSFFPISGPQPLGRVVILSLDVLVNVQILWNAIGTIGSYMSSSLNTGYEEDSGVRPVDTAIMALAAVL
jgi:hypothetical protein